MSSLGVFREASDSESRKSRKRKFVVAGSNLTIDESSVSSEWSTASECDVAAPANLNHISPPNGEPPVAKVRRKRIKKWRVRHSLAKHRHLCDASSSGRSTASSSSNDSSTSTSGSESIQEENVPKSERSQVRNNRRVASVAQMIEVRRNDSQWPRGSVQWLPGSKQHRHLAVAPRFLSSADIEALHIAAKHPSVKEINDRKAYLAFKHKVVRFEMQLRALYPGLYAQLLELMRHADAEGWKKLRKKKNRVYPEIEYIEYDVKLEDGECYIEPHVDNKSGVTLVAMLSPSCDYIGGNSCFRRGSGNEGHRQMRLELGDVVMFRGEKLLHWISNVTAGRRVILQIELSRV